MEVGETLHFLQEPNALPFGLSHLKSDRPLTVIFFKVALLFVCFVLFTTVKTAVYK